MDITVPVLISAAASSALSGVIRFEAPAMSSGPYSESVQSWANAMPVEIPTAKAAPTKL